MSPFKFVRFYVPASSLAQPSQPVLGKDISVPPAIWNTLRCRNVATPWLAPPFFVLVSQTWLPMQSIHVHAELWHNSHFIISCSFDFSHQLNQWWLAYTLILYIYYRLPCSGQLYIPILLHKYDPERHSVEDKLHVRILSASCKNVRIF